MSGGRHVSDHRWALIKPQLTRQETKTEHILSKPHAPEADKTVASLTTGLEGKGVVGKSLSVRNNRVGRRGGKARRSRFRGSRQVPRLPPSIDRITVFGCVRRMAITNNASSQLVTRGSLASIIGGVVTVANTTVSLVASSYKLNKIIVWPAAGSTVTIDQLIGGTAEQALSRESFPGSDMPTGITVDKPVVFVPSKSSYLSMWQVTGANPGDGLMNISGAAGAIMDIHLSVTLFSGVGSVCPTTPTTSTVPLGDFVYMPLDTGNKVTVVALNGANH